MRRCYELRNDDHDKFWTVQVIGKHYLATFGKIGTQGQTQVKTFATNGAAIDKLIDMIEQKERKGYREVGDERHPGAPTSLTDSLSQPTPPSPATRAAVAAAVERITAQTPTEPAHVPGRRRIITNLQPAKGE